jgi:hypothetical protein
MRPEAKAAWNRISLGITLGLTSLLSSDSPSPNNISIYLYENPGLEQKLQMLASTEQLNERGALLFGSDGPMISIADLPVSPDGFVPWINELTLFDVNRYGLPHTTALLVHSFMDTAQNIYSLKEADVFFLYQGNEISFWRVEEIDMYQALTPDSTQSDFIDLENPGEVLDTNTAFWEVYGAVRDQETIVLQTCFTRDGDPNWGRYFVRAVKFGETPIVTP